MSIRIHHIENAPSALLDYVFYGALVAIVVALIIVFRFSRKPQAGQINRNQRENRRKRSAR